MAAGENGDGPAANRRSIPKVIVSEPSSPELFMEEDKADGDGGAHPPYGHSARTSMKDRVARFDIDGVSTGAGSIDLPATMNPEMDASTQSLNYLGQGGDPVMPSPPDGGYGWVIVFAAFMSNFFVDGICNSFSEFQEPFRNEFKSSATMTALIGSVIIAVYLLVGPVVGGFVNKFGSRKVVIAGATISFAAFFVSTYSTNVFTFILCYGIGGGAGFGCIYLPAIVVTGQYFEKKRAMATGIAVAGSGVGTIVMPILNEFVVKEYGWEVAVRVLSVIILSCALFGILYKELDVPAPPDANAMEMQLEELKKRLPSDDDEEEENDDEEQEEEEEELPALPSRSGSHSTRTGEWIDQTNATLAAEAGMDPETMARLRSALSECENGGIDHDGNETGEHTGQTSPVPSKIPLETLQEGHSTSFKQRSGAYQTAEPKTGRSRKLTLTSMGSEMHSNFDVRSHASSRNLSGGLSRISVRDIAASTTRLSKGASSSLSIALSGVDSKELAKPMNRKDIFYGGSIANLKEFSDESNNLRSYRESMLSIPTSVLSRAASKMSVVGDLQEAGTRYGGSRVSRITGGLGPEEEIEMFYDDSKFKCIPLSIRTTMDEMFGLYLLKDIVMILLCISNLLGMMGFYVPFMYLKVLATSNGVDASYAKYLVPLIGVTNTIGRIFFGWFADKKIVSAIAINNFSLIACGVLTIVVTFVSHSLIGLIVYCALFGFIISAYVCLTSIVLADLFGMDNMTASFGLLIVARGVASVFGTPFAGLVFDVTSSYSASFWFAGGIILISGLISCAVPHFYEVAKAQREAEAMEKDDDGKLSVLTERSEENLTEYQRTIQSLRQQHALLREIEDEKKRIAAQKEGRNATIGEDDGENEGDPDQDADHTTALLKEDNGETEDKTA